LQSRAAAWRLTASVVVTAADEVDQRRGRRIRTDKEQGGWEEEKKRIGRGNINEVRGRKRPPCLLDPSSIRH